MRGKVPFDPHIISYLKGGLCQYHGRILSAEAFACSYFNTDIKLNLLENIIFISLDTFESVVHNITTRQEAWLKFLTEDNPEKMVQFVNQYPEFLPYYQDIITFRKKPEELIHMFSDALREMDRNTERYMVEELNKQVEDLKTELNTTIAEKDTIIQELSQKLARYETEAGK